MKKVNKRAKSEKEKSDYVVMLVLGFTDFKDNFFYYQAGECGGNIEKTIEKLQKKRAKK
jgi:hypothetical protein